MNQRRNVYFEGERLPEDGERYVEVPKGNDRMYAITLFNLRRGRERKRTGTATVWRLRWLFEAIASRYPEACKTPPKKHPLTVRTRRAGPVVVIVEPLAGPVGSVAVKH